MVGGLVTSRGGISDLRRPRRPITKSSASDADAGLVRLERGRRGRSRKWVGSSSSESTDSPRDSPIVLGGEPPRSAVSSCQLRAGPTSTVKAGVLPREDRAQRQAAARGRGGGSGARSLAASNGGRRWRPESRAAFFRAYLGLLAETAPKSVLPPLGRGGRLPLTSPRYRKCGVKRGVKFPLGRGQIPDDFNLYGNTSITRELAWLGTGHSGVDVDDSRARGPRAGEALRRGPPGPGGLPDREGLTTGGPRRSDPRRGDAVSATELASDQDLVVPHGHGRAPRLACRRRKARPGHSLGPWLAGVASAEWSMPVAACRRRGGRGQPGCGLRL